MRHEVLHVEPIAHGTQPLRPRAREFGHLLAERFADLHRLLAGHGVRDKKRLGNTDPGLELLELVHEVGVDVQATSGVEDHDVAVEPRRLGDRLLTLAEGDVLPLRQRLQLLDGGGSSKVEPGDQRAVALAPGQ